MVVRKSKIDKKEKPTVVIPKGRKPDPHWNIERLEDAVQDGKLMADIGDELIVVRPRDGKMQKSICTVKGLEKDLVATYDETRGQFYSFPLTGLEKYGIVVKKSLRSGRSLSVKQVPDVRPMDEKADVGSLAGDQGADSDQSAVVVPGSTA